ncbi:hypothetical protein [Pseudomonas luteola]|uniref:Uncharacterized protein n=1 Tax=Pseudomonas luteola TaxID=47886 RepID=A0ABS0MUW8_PSELU|nr:hypothetical protein [Pseudomonas luteola]MBH3440499.1 hypothetical protein [Pseudomonas luteola]
MEDEWVIRELQKAFEKINKKANKEERRKSKKANRALRQASIKRAAEQIAESEKAMLVRPCCECGKPAKADPEFFLNPVKCERCLKNSSIDLGIRPRDSGSFSSITVFKGGAPGLGKRR